MAKRNRNKKNGNNKMTKNDYTPWVPTGHTPACHNSPKLVFTAGNLEVYGSRGGMAWKGNFDLHMPCLEDVTQYVGAPLVTCNLPDDVAKHFPTWVSDVKADNYIGIYWRDGRAPYLTAAWWHGVATALASAAAAKTDGPYKVGVHCMGGHGRTGTALAILAWYFQVETGDATLIDWLRETYCMECIETEEQIEYVAKITGLTCAELPSESYKPVYSYSYKSGVTTKLDDAQPSLPLTTTTANNVKPFKTATPESYRYSMSAYTNHALGAPPPVGWEYVHGTDGTCKLQKMTRAELKTLRRLGYEIVKSIPNPGDYNKSVSKGDSPKT